MLPFEFIGWYFYEAPIAIVGIWRTFLSFFFDFFGIQYHAATLFRPWKLVVIKYDEEQNAIKRYFLNLSARFIGSLVGFVVRITTIFIGLVTIVVWFFGVFVIELLWFLMPLIIPLLLFQGLSYIV